MLIIPYNPFTVEAFDRHLHYLPHIGASELISESSENVIKGNEGIVLQVSVPTTRKQRITISFH